MQPVKIGQRQENIAAKRLEAATGISGAIAQYCAANPIGNARLKLLESGILTPDALAGDKTDTVAACLGVLAAMLPNIEVQREACRAAAAKGLSTATDLADYLVRKASNGTEAMEILKIFAGIC